MAKPIRINNQKDKKVKKRLHPAAIAALALGGVIVVTALAVLLLGTSLLNRLTRTDASQAYMPGATYFATPHDTDEAPEMTPTPTRSPAPVAPQESDKLSASEYAGTGTPMPALPVSEYYQQTRLSAEQLRNLEEDNRDERYINVLLIGADRRSEKGAYNSDTMMIATVDRVNGRLKLTSLLRDMLVDIPGYGYGKLNSAAARGGVQLLFDTIYNNFHIKLDKYVLVDLYTFVEVIDAMNGITVEMTAQEISAANDCIAGLNKQLGVEYLWDGFIFADEGPVHLTGKQALGFIRIRKIDSDFRRAQRQYTVLNTVLATFLSLGAGKQYDLLYDMLPLVETNLTNAQVIEIAEAALELRSNGILNYHMPVDGYFQSGKWERRYVFFCDLPGMSMELNSFIFDCADKPKAAELLTPNPSLPARTPKPSGALITQDQGGLFFPTPTPEQTSEPAPELTPETPPESTQTPLAENTAGVWQ